MADMWAFGTTLWEIFSYGKLPPAAEAVVIKKVNFMPSDSAVFYHPLTDIDLQFYKSGKNLPQPPGCPNIVYHLMMECWSYDPYCRKKPQAAMRDINQVLYQGTRQFYGLCSKFTNESIILTFCFSI